MKYAKTPCFFLSAFFTESQSEAEKYALILCYDENGLSLTGAGQTMRGDFTRMLPRLRQNNLRGELLIKAAKIKGTEKTLTALDATAGLGEDSLLLAAAGYNVRLYEYDPVIAALLSDALKRAKKIPELCDAVSRMELTVGDSIEGMKNTEFPPDVILLDPMFPERQKSALVKKKFQVLHCLEKPCSDENELFNAALSAQPKKIVIKRPLKSAFLAGIKPSYSIRERQSLDCVVPTVKNCI